MAKQLEKNYNPAEVDDRIYQTWMEKGYFHADSSTGKKPYTIVMPPPNITGRLHMGHALDNTLQDILIRFKRMSGYCALWLPGTDHASIATEAKIVEQMNKEGLTKEGIGREKFLERAWAWKEQYGGRICEQLKKMGSLESVLAMMPGAGNLKDVQIDENMLMHTEAIILSMTPKERENPNIIDSSRKKRIAKGSGTSVEDINKLLKQFDQMKKLMKQMTSGKFKGFGGFGKKMKMPF